MGIPYVALYPSDFLADIGHLGNTELGIYWRLVLVYYHDQKPFCNDLDRIRRVAAIHTPEEQKILNEILAEYFVRTTESDGTITWHHVRCDREIDAAKQRHNMAVIHGKAGASKRWGGYRVAIGSLKGGNSNQNQNQKKLLDDESVLNPRVEADATRKKRATRLPHDWFPGKEGTEFCVITRPDLNVQATFDAFRDYWTAKAGQSATKSDWMATWRNWVRNQKVKS